MKNIIYLIAFLSGMAIAANESLPLHHAVGCRDVEQVGKLLQDVATHDETWGRSSDTVLHYAANIRNSSEIIKLLLQAGFDVNARNSIGETPLHKVSGVENARILIESGADVNAQNIHGETPLHEVTEVRVCKLLIEAKADVNDKENEGLTPLHLAYDASIAAALIEAGADVNARDNHGKTPLMQFCGMGGYLQDELPAVGSHRLSIIKCLLMQGADANMRNNNGMAALHYAAERGDRQSAYYLILAGADLSAADNAHESVLQTARKGNHTKFAQMIELHIKEPFSPEHLLYRCASHGNACGVQILLNRGVNPNAIAAGITSPPLSAAIISHSSSVVRALLSAGADANWKNELGRSHLHHACQLSDVDIISLLLEFCADKDARDNAGLVPLDYVRANLREKIETLWEQPHARK